jgi:hypothetical protein
MLRSTAFDEHIRGSKGKNKTALLLFIVYLWEGTYAISSTSLRTDASIATEAFNEHTSRKVSPFPFLRTLLLKIGLQEADLFGSGTK